MSNKAKKRGPKGYLYTVYRNKDDHLMILDGTTEQCCEVMGISKAVFYTFLCRKSPNWTIVKNTRSDIKADMEDGRIEEVI